MTENNNNIEEWIANKWGASNLPIGGVVPLSATSLSYKTGDWRIYIPILHDDKCTGCTKCYFICPDDAIIMDDQFHPEFKLDYCKGCALCEDICQTKAIEMLLEEK